jgi:hypothetical protein
MSVQWRLALRYAAGVLVVASVIGAFVGLGYGWDQGLSLGYGVVVGIVCFVSTALTVSMLTGRSMVWRALGSVTFFGRLMFVVAALGVPAYYGAWPVAAMVVGFAAVYLAEHVMLVPVVLKFMSRPGAGRETVERGVEA